MPLGSTQPIAVDVRIVSSSNCPPDELVRNGELRPDLLYRLNTVTLAIPPLNQRPDDIPLLSEYFLYKYSSVRPAGPPDGPGDDSFSEQLQMARQCAGVGACH